MAKQADIDALKDEATAQGASLRQILEDVKADKASHNEVNVADLKDELDANGQLVKDIQSALADSESQPTPPPANGDSVLPDSNGDDGAATNTI